MERESAMAIETLQVIPLLRIFDVDKAKEFYLDYLGFTVDWEHRFDDNAPLYMQVSKGRCVLHLTEHHGDCSPGSTVFVWLTGIEELHRDSPRSSTATCALAWIARTTVPSA